MIKYLLKFGSEINPCDICVYNKMFNGKMTTVLHLDYMKVLHHNYQQVPVFIEWLKPKDEGEGLNKLKSTRGKVHYFLGMNLDFTKPGRVAVDMKTMLKRQLKVFQWI